MYLRQRILLALLENLTKQRASKLQFLKLLFLLKEEEGMDRFVSFYDFLPYKYGPFSFVAYREMEELEQDGFIQSEKNSVKLRGKNLQVLKWELPQSVTQSINHVIEKYGKLSQDKLLEYVYRNFPWYSTRTEISPFRKSLRLPKPDVAIHTLGYEGLSIDAVLNLLLHRKIKCLIDCRSNPISRKYGFSRSILTKRCEDFSIKYHSFPDMGIPTTLRRNVHSKSSLWKIYLNDILRKARPSLEKAADLAKSSATVLFCFEKDPYECHRHLLARQMKHLNGLPIIHYLGRRKEWVKE